MPSALLLAVSKLRPAHYPQSLYALSACSTAICKYWHRSVLHPWLCISLVIQIQLELICPYRQLFWTNYQYICCNTISTHLILGVHEWKIDAMNREVATLMNVAVPENRNISFRDISQCCRRLGYIIFWTPSVPWQTYKRGAYRLDNQNCCSSSNTRGFNIITLKY